MIGLVPLLVFLLFLLVFFAVLVWITDQIPMDSRMRTLVRIVLGSIVLVVIFDLMWGSPALFGPEGVHGGLNLR